MAYVIRVDPDLGCAFIRHFGEMERGEGLTSTKALVRNADYAPGMNILKDYSDIARIADYDFQFAASHKHRLVEFDAGLVPCKLALVSSAAGTFGLLRQVCLLTDGSHVQREAFTDLSDAAAWIGVSPDAALFEAA